MRRERLRLRAGEVLAGVAALALLALLLAVPWYGMRDGWRALPAVRWLLLVTIASALALAYLQATRRAPALPAVLSAITTVLGTTSSAALVWGVLISPPDAGAAAGGARAGAYGGLACALALAGGAFRSLREEDRPDPDREARIPTVQMDPPSVRSPTGPKPYEPPGRITRPPGA